MLNSLPVRLLWRSFNWLTRLVIVFFATVAVLFALVIIAMRYWVLPDIEWYHDDITASVSAAIGNPVTIGKIAGDWQGFQPRLNFADVRILDDKHQAALALKHVEGSVSWMSLLTAQMRLASLEIDQPELLVRRDVNGKVFVGGVELSKKSGNNDLADWLLHQSRMVVRDAIIVWVDEFHGAPPLELRQVNLRVENLFNHHRFALRARPPENLASPLDVRGDFQGTSFDDTEGWRGNIFTQLDFTDLAAWRPWLDLPKEFNRGRGALRGWLYVEDGKVAGITADAALYNVVTKLAADVPEMELTSMRGRAAWHEVRGGFEISTKGLALKLKDGIELQPTDFYLRMAKADNEQLPEGEIRANLLQLEKITALAKFIPMADEMRTRLDAYAPRGKVSNLNAQWRGMPEKPANFKLKGHFENFAVNQVGTTPGFSGLTMDIDGNQASGKLNINANRMIVDAPEVMIEPLSFSTLDGQLNWQHKDGELLIEASNFTFANGDLAGNLFGNYQTRAGTLGVLDLTATLKRGDIRSAYRYTPLIALNKQGNEWLKNALLTGHTEDLRIRIKGSLSDFPLDGTKPTLFEIEGHAQSAALEFDRSWPRIENIYGEFFIHGNKLEVRSNSAMIAGARLQNVTVALPDMMSADLPLEIRGEALATSNVLLQFIQKSPVRGYIDGFTDGMSASGNGHLDLFVRLPLQGNKPVKVSGTVSVMDSDINLGPGMPLLRKTRGSLSFNESGMHAKGVSAEILGGAAIINVQSSDGGAVHATAQGHLNLDVVRKIEPLSVLNYLHGSTAWDADVRVLKKSAQFIIKSNLQGISSSLPQPFTKSAGDIMPLRVEKKPILQERNGVDTQGADGQFMVIAELGNLLNANLEGGYENGSGAIKRGTLVFGAPKKPESTRKVKKSRRAKEAVQEEPGVWLTGSLPELSMEGWGGLSGVAGKSDFKIPLAGINLDIEKLTGYGQNISALHISASKRGDGLAAQLSSAAVNGEVIWQPHGFEAGGKLSARLRNLQWDLNGKPAPIQAGPVKPEVTTEGLKPGNLPALDVSIENFVLAKKQIGRFEIVGYPDKSDWRMRRLRLTNPDGNLLGDGLWIGAPGNTQTQFNLTLEISDAGKVLARSGYPNMVKNGSGKLAANLTWAGRPDEFNSATLNGTLKLDTGKGQFLKMESGAGKLLSILSLQALPKRLTLDFNDVFSEGFQFDNIIGDASIRNGVMETQELHIYGSAAKVALKGSVDLNNETQNLSVKVFPAVGDSVSLLAVFAINPAVGIGSLIASTLLGNPLDKLVSFEYNISGTWNDPQVVKIGGPPAKTNPGNLGNQ